MTPSADDTSRERDAGQRDAGKPDTRGRGNTQHGAAATTNATGPGLPAETERARTTPRQRVPDPGDVLTDESLSRDQKIEKLRRWAYDARELEVANSEGMRGALHASNLPAILEALRTLGANEDPSADAS